jgi:hypothetical protein
VTPSSAGGGGRKRGRNEELPVVTIVPGYGRESSGLSAAMLRASEEARRRCGPMSVSSTASTASSAGEEGSSVSPSIEEMEEAARRAEWPLPTSFQLGEPTDSLPVEAPKTGSTPMPKRRNLGAGGNVGAGGGSGGGGLGALSVGGGGLDLEAGSDQGVNNSPSSSSNNNNNNNNNNINNSGNGDDDDYDSDDDGDGDGGYTNANGEPMKLLAACFTEDSAAPDDSSGIERTISSSLVPQDAPLGQDFKMEDLLDMEFFDNSYEANLNSAMRQEFSPLLQRVVQMCSPKIGEAIMKHSPGVLRALAEVSPALSRKMKGSTGNLLAGVGAGEEGNALFSSSSQGRIMVRRKSEREESVRELLRKI